jgi:hypothetical protein
MAAPSVPDARTTPSVVITVVEPSGATLSRKAVPRTVLLEVGVITM